MALEDCLEKALKAHAIDKKAADRIRQHAAGREMSDEQIIETFIKDAIEAKRRAQLQAIANRRNIANVKGHPKGIGRGVEGLLVRDLEGKAPYSNVDYRRLSILADLHARWADAMSAYRTRNLGFSQDRAGLKKMVWELFGQSTGDADAARYAQMWRDVAEVARMRFNVAGGSIPRRKDWGLPHVHNARNIAKVSFEEWADYIVPRLDRSRMYDKQGMKMTLKEFDQLVNDLYDRFTIEAGVASRDIDRTVPKKADHRLLTFKDAKSWWEYNDRFGNPDVYHTMTNHLDHLSGDIALMEILGPNSDAAIHQFYEMAQKSGYPYLSKDLMHGTKIIKDSFQVLTGRVNQAESEAIAGFASGVRNLLSSAQLGTAFVSSFTDMWTNRMTLAANGLPATRLLRGYLRLMNPANEAARTFAVKLGLGAEAWITRALAATRLQEMTGQGITAAISDKVFRASLLSSWTDAGRKVFGMELLGFFGDNAGKGFKELPELLQRNMQRYGIDEAAWEIIRRAPLIERQGAKYLRPMDVLELSKEKIKELGGIFAEAAEDIEAEMKLRGSRAGALGRRLQAHDVKIQKIREGLTRIEDAANKLHEMVLTEMDFAVPMPDARIRAMVTQGLKRGSLWGEVARSFALYKQFPVTMISTHLYRGALTLNGKMERGRYLAELMLGLTAMGAVSYQARQVMKGRDPEDMTDPKFWGQAFAQGGGAGIYGDFIRATESRFGKGFTSTVAGPVFGLVDDIAMLTGGNLAQYLAGKEANFMRDTVYFAKRYTPGSSGWYARLALERLFWDQLQKAADPKANQSFRRAMQRARRDYGQEFWWRPGEPAPRRAPRLP